MAERCAGCGRQLADDRTVTLVLDGARDRFVWTHRAKGCRRAAQDVQESLLPPADDTGNASGPEGTISA